MRLVRLLAVALATGCFVVTGELWSSALNPSPTIVFPTPVQPPPRLLPGDLSPHGPAGILRLKPVPTYPLPVRSGAHAHPARHGRTSAGARAHRTGRIGTAPPTSARSAGLVARSGEATPPAAPTPPAISPPPTPSPPPGAKPPKSPGKPAPPATPPVPTPPVSTPPVSTPPAQTPAPPSGATPGPGTTPPVSTPPVSTPPVSTPPVSTPPVSTPPVSTPPVSTPPVSTPPVSTPPVSTPPASTPPTTPTQEPPTPPTPTPPPQASDTRPGHGYGDKNHTHTGPPGQAGP